ncbi:hypothetical protein D3C81_1303330 [compost metagenome]
MLPDPPDPDEGDGVGAVDAEDPLEGDGVGVADAVEALPLGVGDVVAVGVAVPVTVSSSKKPYR